MAARMAFVVLAGLALVTGAQTTVNAATTDVNTTMEPSTLAPTTTDVTTLAPTTTLTVTTTLATTTVAPTTVAGATTTMAPTTVAPTVAPTAAATTVAGATTQAPTTVAGATTVAPGATTAAPATTTMAPTVAGATTMAPSATTMAPGATTVAPGATTMAPGATTMAPVAGATVAPVAGVPIAGAATTTAQSQGVAVADSHPNLLGTLIYPMPAATVDSVLKGRQTGIAAHFEEMMKVAEAVEKQAGLLASTVSTRFILKLKYQFSFNFMTEPNVETKVRSYDAAKSLSCSLALIMAGKCSVSLVNEDLASLRAQVQQLAALRGGLRRLQAAQTGYPAYNLTMGYNLNITDPAEANGLTLPADSAFDSDFLNMAENVLDAQLPGQNVKDNLVAVSKPVVSAQTLVQVLAEEDKKDVEYHKLQAQALMPAPLTTAYASATNSSLGAVTPVVDLCMGRSCGGNGVCVHGTCLCNAGWSRPNCLVALNTVTQAPSSSSNTAMTSLMEDHPWPWAVVIGLAVITLLVCCALCAWALMKPQARLLKKEAMVDQTVIEKTYI